jgi:hypothetical protein
VSLPLPSSSACAASSDAGAPAAGATRVQATVAKCLPVGYGLACSCSLDSADPALRGHAKLESCVGGRDPNSLIGRLGAVPMAGGAGSPLSMWMDVAPAPESKRYCGVLILDSGAHFEIVDFERAPAP